MTRVANWGRWILAATLLASAIVAGKSVVVTEFSNPLQSITKHWLVVGFSLLIDIAIWTAMIRAVLAFKAWVYWLLVAINILGFFRIFFLLLSGHLHELDATQRIGSVICLATLIWLALPSVYNQYWGRKEYA